MAASRPGPRDVVVTCWNRQRDGRPARYDASLSGVTDGVAMCARCGADLHLDGRDIPAHDLDTGRRKKSRKNSR